MKKEIFYKDKLNLGGTIYPCHILSDNTHLVSEKTMKDVLSDCVVVRRET